MKKKLLPILIVVLAISVFALVGCESARQYEGVKVVFMLEGSTFQNGTDSVVQYYNFEEGTQNLIKPLQDFAEDGDFVNPGYEFAGWYLTKNDDGTYSDLWNFENDTVGDDGVTLYAWWKIQVRYAYKIYDYETRELVSTKFVNENVSFNSKYATRSGYTYISAYDEEGNLWDSNSPCPSGERLEVAVYVKYLQGSYSIVKTASELKLAVSGNNNIYLANDIDLEGALFSFGDFQKELVGNGYTIGNFTLLYGSGYDGTVTRNDLIEDFDDSSKKSLSISLFGCTNGANIHDVTLSDVIVCIKTTYDGIYKIYVAPIATKAVNTTITNVSVSGTISVVALPSSFETDSGRLVITTNNAYFEEYAQNSTVSEFVSQLIQNDNNSEE